MLVVSEAWLVRWGASYLPQYAVRNLGVQPLPVPLGACGTRFANRPSADGAFR